MGSPQTASQHGAPVANQKIIEEKNNKLLLCKAKRRDGLIRDAKLIQLEL